MEIKLNGEPMTVAERLTVLELLESLQKNPKFLAVEVNKELVPRTQHAGHALSENDEVEIVTLVGGG